MTDGSSCGHDSASCPRRVGPDVPAVYAADPDASGHLEPLVVAPQHDTKAYGAMPLIDVSASYDEANDVSALDDGAAYVTGYYTTRAGFGVSETNETVLTSAGDEDLFVARFNNDGSLDWVRSEGGTGTDVGTGIAAYPDGSAGTNWGASPARYSYSLHNTQQCTSSSGHLKSPAVAFSVTERAICCVAAMRPLCGCHAAAARLPCGCCAAAPPRSARWQGLRVARLFARDGARCA